MATTFLDLIVVPLWPLVLSAVAWAIVINALSETDEISEVVETLTRPNGVEENAKRGETSTRRSNCDRKRRWRLVSGSFRTHAAYGAQHIKAKGQAIRRTLLHDDDRRGDCAAVARILRDH